jgi:rhodanese-related sulfurtransferase
MASTVTPAQLKAMLHDGKELALLDVREGGRFGDNHLLWACSVPFSRLELRVGDLVPRRATRVVLSDEADGLAERAAGRLAGFGYTQVSVLTGGIQGWQQAGYELFSGVNVPSKAFGEFVEHECHTPSISAQELKGLVERGDDLVILDSRPMDEFKVMAIPGGVDCPGAELVYRVGDMAPKPDTLVVVNCAGRTRSIIGAQSLINAGIPNKVVALRNGTMGWHLSGLTVERGASRTAPAPSARALAEAQTRAAQVAQRFDVKTVDAQTVASWQRDATRTTLLLDVRSPEEYAAGHLAGARSAPGGQLVQATDTFTATRGARLVLVDDTGVRAIMTASWLVQMGWEVWVLKDAMQGASLQPGKPAPAVLGLGSARPVEVEPEALSAALASGETLVIDLATSLDYKAGHIAGAWFAVRSRFAKGLAAVPRNVMVVLTSPDGALARLAAADAAEALGRPVQVLRGGTQAWKALGLPLKAGAEHLADTPDDVWLRPYDREQGQEAAMKEYLSWEVDLVDQIRRDGDAVFKIVAPAAH